MDPRAEKKDESGEKELNAFVQSLLKQMQDRFEEMSTGVVTRIDEMGTFNQISPISSNTLTPQASASTT